MSTLPRSHTAFVPHGLTAPFRGTPDGPLAGLTAAPQRLPAMAVAARSVGRLDAADRLAELVLKVAAAGANQ